MSTPLVVLGAGGHALDLVPIIERIGGDRPAFRVLGLLDDGDPTATEFGTHGSRVLGKVALLVELTAADPALQYFAAVGTPGGRRAITAALPFGIRAAVVVDPLGAAATSARLDEGVLVAHHAVVGAGAVLGRHVHVSHAAVLGTDVTAGPFSAVLPHAVVGEGVVLGADVTVGSGAVVDPGVRVGEGATIGAGAVVTDDVPPGATVVGDPARVLRR